MAIITSWTGGLIGAVALGSAFSVAVVKMGPHEKPVPAATCADLAHSSDIGKALQKKIKIKGEDTSVEQAALNTFLNNCSMQRNRQIALRGYTR